jgi:hypothetical protein
MSYDLYALPIGPDDEPEDVLAAVMDFAEDDEGDRWTDAAKARADATAKALIALNPLLEPYAFDYAAIAEFEKITEAAARERYQHIELNGPEGGSPVQIELESDHASISVPYWYSGDDAREKLGEMLSYLATIESQTGWRAYDPQLSRMIDVGDLDEMVSMYEVGTRAVHGAAGSEHGDADGKPRKKRFGLF